MEKIIQSLLLDNETVELPGLGVFKKRFRPAHIDNDDTIYPPSVKPSFDLDKTVKGQELIGAIAVANNISTEDASLQLRQYVSGINNSISNKGSYSFEGLGTLLKFASGKLDFAPSKGSNFLLETLGLSAIRLPKQVVDINTQAKVGAVAAAATIATNKLTDKVEVASPRSATENVVINPVKTEIVDTEKVASPEAKEAPKTESIQTPKAEPTSAPKTESTSTPIKEPISTPKPEPINTPPDTIKESVERAEVKTTPVIKEAAKPETVKAKPAPLKEPVKQEAKKIAETIKEKPAPQKVAKRVIAKPKKKRAVWKMLLPLILLLGGAWALFNIFSGNEVAVNSAAPVTKVESAASAAATETTPTETRTKSEGTTDAATNVAEPETKPVIEKKRNVIASNTAVDKGYYVITGAFSESANAQKAIQALKADGFDARIIKAGRFHQVGVFATENVNQAKVLQSKMVKRGNRDAWIMKR